MQYTIEAVSPETRNFDTKFGAMTSYKIKLKEHDGVVELAQKASTPTPTVGQTLQGTIDVSGQFGPKFKKEYSQGGFTQSSSSASSQSSSPQSSGTTSTGKFQSDPFTMYLSYAKDVAVALIGSKAGYDEEQYSKILEDVLKGGEVLYDGRPGAEPKAEDKPKDNLPDDLFDGSQPVDVGEIPF